MRKPFTQIEIKAIALSKLGYSDADICKECDRSPSWLAKLRQREEYKEIPVQELNPRLKYVMAEVFRQQATTYAKQYIELADFLYEKSLKIIEKLLQRVEDLLENGDPDSIPVGLLPTYLKTMGEYMQMARVLHSHYEVQEEKGGQVTINIGAAAIPQVEDEETEN